MQAGDSRLIDFPAGLPVRLAGPSAWHGPALAGRDDWIEPPLPAELDELAADFPLPVRAPRFASMTEELLLSRGSGAGAP
ncbi:MAG: hypothetical protein ABI569_03630 [Casimicrobiaceae bacterium]